jgi:hypothetical protein
MPDDVYAAMKLVQAPQLLTMSDGSTAKAQSSKLLARDHTMLLCGEGCEALLASRRGRSIAPLLPSARSRRRGFVRLSMHCMSKFTNPLSSPSRGLRPRASATSGRC